MGKSKQSQWKYGDPAHETWHQVGEFIKGNRPKKGSGNTLMERIDQIEKLLKEKK